MIERMHLKILREIDKQGSVTAAAEALHLTQSALSHNIKKLEQQIGTSIWIKDGRKLQFTETGHYLIYQSKRLLPQLERIDEVLKEYAIGSKGLLRIGMECHPCFEWLMNVVEPFLNIWSDVDVDIKRNFEFGGMGALFNHEIDILVTPDPLHKVGVIFEPALEYEQVLLMHNSHHLTAEEYILPEHLSEEVLFSYPINLERLDIYNAFLMPANCLPKQHKTIEATEMIFQLIHANRGVAALPNWLIKNYAKDKEITYKRLGKTGLQNTIYLGMRTIDEQNLFIRAFIDLAIEVAKENTQAC